MDQKNNFFTIDHDLLSLYLNNNNESGSGQNQNFGLGDQNIL